MADGHFSVTFKEVCFEILCVSERVVELRGCLSPVQRRSFRKRHDGTILLVEAATGSTDPTIRFMALAGR